MELKDWLATLAGELDLTDVALDEPEVQLLLELARDAAHEVQRVAAPLSTFLVGVAVGRGATLSEAVAAASRLLSPPQR